MGSSNSETGAGLGAHRGFRGILIAAKTRDGGAAMSAMGSKLGACAIGVTCLLAASNARADIIFCNKFPHLIYVAVAYPQQDGSWISRGWLTVDPDKCAEFDTALRVKALYYRAESVSYREGGHSLKNTWGTGDDKFAIWENDNFNYWNAQTKVLNSSLAVFSKVGETNGEALSATVTIEADGIHTTTSIPGNSGAR